MRLYVTRRDPDGRMLDWSPPFLLSEAASISHVSVIALTDGFLVGYVREDVYGAWIESATTADRAARTRKIYEFPATSPAARAPSMTTAAP